ncbi:MAG: FAD-dependent oxidoreductase, partial [Spirochaetales bacterium]|nr:FAD-dependent oxidoreductase [Spirochaetales bacterium]
MRRTYDVMIIGAGAVGCAVARDLSRYSIDVLVLEKECDVAYGTSGRMSGVVHAGFNNRTGSLMAKLCVEGNRGFEAVTKELGIPYRKTGKVLVAFDQDDMKALEGIIERGRANGCDGLKLLDQDEIRAIVPGIGGIGGMPSPNTAIFDPFEFCIAHAENAMDNGVGFSFGSEVTAIRKDGDVFSVTTPKGVFKA